MGEPKTKPTDADVEEFLAAIAPAQRRADAIAVSALIRDATGDEPVVWGTSIVGFGSTTQGGGAPSWPVLAFAPRRTELVLYLHGEIEPERFDGLGPHRRGVGCLYVKRLDDLDQQVFVRVLDRSVELARE